MCAVPSLSGLEDTVITRFRHSCSRGGQLNSFLCPPLLLLLLLLAEVIRSGKVSRQDQIESLCQHRPTTPCPVAVSCTSKHCLAAAAQLALTCVVVSLISTIVLFLPPSLSLVLILITLELTVSQFACFSFLVDTTTTTIVGIVHHLTTWLALFGGGDDDTQIGYNETKKKKEKRILS